MNDTQLETIEQIEAFLLGTQPIELIIESKADRYAWIQRTLIRLDKTKGSACLIFNLSLAGHVVRVTEGHGVRPYI